MAAPQFSPIGQVGALTDPMSPDMEEVARQEEILERLRSQASLLQQEVDAGLRDRTDAAETYKLWENQARKEMFDPSWVTTAGGYEVGRAMKLAGMALQAPERLAEEFNAAPFPLDLAVSESAIGKLLERKGREAQDWAGDRIPIHTGVGERIGMGLIHTPAAIARPDRDPPPQDVAPGRAGAAHPGSGQGGSALRRPPRSGREGVGYAARFPGTERPAGLTGRRHPTP